MCLFFGNVCTACFSAPLEVVAGWFSWSPLEVGTRYLSGAAYICIRVDLVVLFWMGFIFPFVNIALTASMAANCEFHMLDGTSLSTSVKNCIACVILYSAVIWVCVRYLCKYSAVSMMINVLVFLSIS